MKKRKSKLRIHGNDRGLMMICKDIRRRWMQYGESRQEAWNLAKLDSLTYRCVNVHTHKTNGVKEDFEIDHIEPVGSRPREFEDLGIYAIRMFTLKCQVLCGICHLKKTTIERKRRKNAKA